MMLNLLLDYARREKLSAEPGYKVEPVRWLLSFVPDGRYVGAIRRGADKGKGDDFVVPRLSQPEMKAGGSGTRHFLCDTLEVVTLYGTGDEVDPKLRAKHDFFVKQLREAASALPVLAVIAAALSDQDVRRQINDSLTSKEMAAKPLENATFHVDGHNPDILIESVAWRDWYASYRETLQKNKSERLMISLAGGTAVTPAKTHPKVTGLAAVGGQAAGDVLASFKQPAFRHYGLEQSENAAISEEEAAAYRGAINHLLREKAINYAGAKTVYWYSRPLPEDFDPVIDAGLFDTVARGEATGEEELPGDAAEVEPEDSEVEAKAAAMFEGKARRLLEAIQSGEAPHAVDTRLHLLTLAANSGRVVVRDAAETDFAALLEALLRWREDLRVTRLNAAPAIDPPKLERLLTAPLPPKPPVQKYADWIKPVQRLRDLLFREAVGLGGGGVLRAAVVQLLPQWRASVMNGDFGEAVKSQKAIAARGRLYARVALMKAFLEREDTNMSVALDEDHPEDVYHYGRLVAVLADLQRRALGEVGAGVVQRYYARASTAPLDAVGPLIRLSNAHLNKLKPRIAQAFQRQIASIYGKVKGERLSTTLDARGQSVFAMGFYHQIATIEQLRAKRVAEKKGREQKGGNNNG